MMAASAYGSPVGGSPPMSPSPGGNGLGPESIQPGVLSANSLQEMQTALTTAANLLNRTMTSDGRVPELADFFNSSWSAQYANSVEPTANEPVLQKKVTVELPKAILDQYEYLECKCFLGLFPEINRAWLTIDNRLFLWNYDNGSDFQSYDELDQIIVSVALVPPREGIFIAEIKHLLVIATPVETILLGVCVAEGRRGGLGGGDLTLYPTQLYVPSDNINMLSIKGTDNGRIFMCGQDGNLHELVYQAEDGWFVRKCRKVNRTQGRLAAFTPTFLKFVADDPIMAIDIDNSRNILYTLSEHNVIQVFYLGRSGTELHRVAVRNDVANEARRQSNMQLDLATFRIVSIHAVTMAESAQVHLVAVTSNGARLYFTTRRSPRLFGGPGGFNLGSHASPSSPASQQRPNAGPSEPEALELMHVRWAPSLSSAQNASNGLDRQIPSRVHTAFYSAGTLILANAVSDETDLLIGVSQDLGDFVKQTGRSSLVEVSSESLVEGKTWAIAERTPQSVSAAVAGSRTNPLAAQLSQPPRQFLCLTNTYIAVLQEVRPLDHLRQLLVEVQGQPTHQIVKFFQRYTPDEACCMCLALACSTSAGAGSSVARMPASSSMGMMRGGDENVAQYATSIFFHYGGVPQSIQRTDTFERVYGSSLDAREVQYSSMHNAIVRYFARLVRPVWKLPVVSLAASPEAAQTLLATVSEQLTRLKNFMIANQHIMGGTRSSATADHYRTDYNASLFGAQATPVQANEEAQQQQQQSLRSLERLLIQTIEALSFLSTLYDHNISDLATRASSGTVPAGPAGAVVPLVTIKNLQFENLVTTTQGRDIAKELAAALLNKQIHLGASVESLLQIFRARCPTILSSNDLTLFRATEVLQRAKDVAESNPVERNNLLQESLRLFHMVAAHITPVKLQTICNDYMSMRFHAFAIDLCLLTASSCDPTNQATHFHIAGRPINDPREPIFRLRLALYECAIHVLEEAEALSSRRPTSGTNNTDSEAVATCDMAFKVAFSSNDALWHEVMYQWMIDADEKTLQRLLGAETPYVEVFLSTKANDEKDPNPDLLAQYYLRNNRFLDAAQTLFHVASMPCARYNLARRIEYLAKAKLAARSIVPTSGTTDTSDLSRDIDEYMEVAAIQQQILTLLERRPATDETLSATRALNETILSVTDLYANYARKFQLHETALAIFHCSHFNDIAKIEDVWTKILNEEAAKSFSSVVATVLRIGRQYHPSNSAFPAENLVHKLERFTWQKYRDTVDGGWVAQTMLDVGVLPETLYLTYQRMFQTRAYDTWVRDETLRKRALVQMLRSIATILEKWWATVATLPAQSLRRPAAEIEKAIDSNLVALGQYSTEPGAAAVEERLRVLQTRVRQR